MDIEDYFEGREPAKWLSGIVYVEDLEPGEPYIDLDHPPEDALRQVALLYGDEDAECCFRTFSDLTRDGRGRNYTACLREAWPDLARDQCEGRGVFILPNAGGHTDAEIDQINAIWMDADGVDLNKALGTLSEMGLPPDFVCQREDDPGRWHAYIRVEGFTPDEFSAVQQELAERFGTDEKIFNPSRVMRLAGTLHQKPKGAGA